MRALIYLREIARGIPFVVLILPVLLFCAGSMHAQEKADLPFYGIQFDPDSTDVVQVLQVIKGGPAEKAGLRSKDIVTKVDGKKFNNLRELRKLIRAKKPGDKVPFMVRREDKSVTIDIVAGKPPE